MKIPWGVIQNGKTRYVTVDLADSAFQAQLLAIIMALVKILKKNEAEPTVILDWEQVPVKMAMSFITNLDTKEQTIHLGSDTKNAINITVGG